MKIFRTISSIKEEIKKLKNRGKKIGFVPTMGALHDGHVSLIKKARKETDVVVVSIFVNPRQFGQNEDYEVYPRNLKADADICRQSGVDIIFAPTVKEMYPDDYLTRVEQEKLPDRLCGLFRPGHFSGVMTVVLKLFNIVAPDIAYFGQKDYQQAVIVKKMITDFNLDIKLKVLPTVRERDGLAMSSRNIYLSAEERKEATSIFKSLLLAKKLIKEDSIFEAERVKNEIRKILMDSINNCSIDYISIVEPKTLEELKVIKLPAVVAVAVRIGKTRLIDNIIIR